MGKNIYNLRERRSSLILQHIVLIITIELETVYTVTVVSTNIAFYWDMTPRAVVNYTSTFRKNISKNYTELYIHKTANFSVGI